MKEEILKKLSEIVNGLDGHNYKEGFSKIKDFLGQLRGIMDPATLDEVCEIFGDDYTVRGILQNYFNSGETSLVNSLEDYLSASVSALDGDVSGEADEVYSTFTTEFPNIINTEEIENMNKEASIKDVKITDDGMLKALVELPAVDAAKVLTEVAHEESLGGSVADELAKAVINGDPKAELSDALKPVAGKVVQIIDTRSDIEPECFSVSKIKSYNKYMYMFSEATDPIRIDEQALEAACNEEECGLEAALEAPEEIPVKSTVVETNSALPTVEQVEEVSMPVSYVDSEMVRPGESAAVDALAEVSEALGNLEEDQSAGALGLIAEQIGPEAAEAIQGEVLAKANPELFSNFSKNSWITDQEVFAAYNVLSNYFSGKITNFSTESGSALKQRFLSNFSSAVKLVDKHNENFSVAKTFNVSSLKKLGTHWKNLQETAIDIGKYDKVAADLAEEMARKTEVITQIKKRINELEKIDPKKNLNEINELKGLLSEARSNFRDVGAAFERQLTAGGGSSVGDVVENAGVWATIKDHPIATGLIGGSVAGAGVLGGMTMAKNSLPTGDVNIDMYEGFSSKNNEYYFSEESDVMDLAVSEALNTDSIEATAELLAEVAEKVSPEVALAIQAEMCKDSSESAKKLADSAIVDEEEVEEALAVIEDVKQNGTQEQFSESKTSYFKDILNNFAVLSKEILFSEDEEDEEDEDDEDFSNEEQKEDGQLINLDKSEVDKSSPEMEEVVEKFENLPTIEDAATLLVEIEDKVGPEAALAVQSEILKNNSELFKKINDEMVMDDDVVKEVYSIVKGFSPDSEFNFSEAGMDRYKVYVRNFSEAIPNEEKAAIIEEIKQQVLNEMAGAPAPEAAPVHPVDPAALPPIPPVAPEAAPIPAEAAPVVPPAPTVPVAAPIAPEAVPAPAPIPEVPVPAEAPVIPPPGMAAAPQAPVSVEYPGQFIPPTGTAPIDPESVIRPDIAPVVPGLVAPAPTLPHPFATEEGVAEVPPLPMDAPSEAVVTSTTGEFTPSAVNAPKYVHLVQQSPMEQMQATMPPVEPAVGNPQMPPMQQLSDVEVQKAIVDNFSRARRQVSFSSTKESEIEAYKRAIEGR